MASALTSIDPFTIGLQLARRSQRLEFADRIGFPPEYVMDWRRRSADLAPWVLRTAAEVLDLDEQELLEHRRERQRRDDREAEYLKEGALARWAS